MKTLIPEQHFARSLLALASAGLFAGLLGSAAAQTLPTPAAPPAADKPDADKVEGLERIVITAQKRSEPLQEVPIAVTAFDAKLIEKTGATDIRDIAIRTPGFTMTQYNIGEPQYSIRGMSSSSDSAAGDATVAVFVDEVFIGRPAGANFSFLDLERLEVLRGPQGTLFGRNTSGGAISVTTARPSQQASSKLFASLGNHGAVDVGAVLNRPVGEAVKVKLALGHRQHKGYSQHILTGSSLDGGKSDSSRLQALIDLSSSTSLLLSADMARDRGDGLARVPYPVVAGTAMAPLINSIYPPGTNPRLAFSDPASFQNRDVHGFSARIEHELDFASLTSITAYRATKLHQMEDLSALPPPWVLRNLNLVKEDASQWSQELRLASRPGAKFSWVTGLFYFNETVLREESFDTAFKLLPAAGGHVMFTQDVKNTSAALFGQVDYPLAEKLNLSAGLRETFDKKTADQAAINLAAADPTPGIPLFPGQPYKVVASKSWNALTGKLGLDYRLAKDKMAYASVSRGFKSGMFPSQNNSVQTIGTPLEPEYVTSLELGLKSEWLERRLRLNASIFKFDYKNLQQYNLTPQLVLASFNVDAKAKGAEIELLAAPTDWLTLGGNVGALHSEILRGEAASVNLAGKQLARAPKTTYGVFAEASTALAAGKLSGRIEYAHKGDFFIEASNVPTSLIPAYGLWDARLSFRPYSKGPEFALWGKNLRDTLYQTHVISFLNNGFSVFGPPRTVGASVAWNFNE